GGGGSGTIRNNLVGFSAGKGLQLGGGSTAWLVENNEVRFNGIGNPSLDGIDIENGSGGCTVRGNLFVGNEGAGIDTFQSSGGNTIENNTVTGNGIGTGASAVTPGVRVYGAGSTVSLNIINANFGAGVMVTSGATASVITRNSIFANGTITNKSAAGPSGQIGIDLLSAANSQLAGTSPFVTTNDSGDADAGGNGLLNFPVLTSARVIGGNITLQGYSRPGAAIELFVAAPDPSGFGEGQTYLLTLTEGSAADTDAGTGTYTSPLNGLNVGTDTTNLFSFTIPVPAGVAVGTVLTSTATLSGATSEFSGNVTVAAAPPDVTLVKSCPAPADCTTAPQQPGTDLTYQIDFANVGGSPAQSFVITDQIPSDTDFKVGSVTTNLGTTGLTVSVVYSNDGGTTYTYTPVSGAGGAPAGYDRSVTHVRWVFTGNLVQTAPNNAGSVSFIARIR
ncbi:MAG TPA: right-handed parallel beta-helix repeat-containing protein, partial [Pyrinomonadaceae bacterium]|nr:right-handed parallel beta-helix repeat-containing protein [Pyrinomonadaceae bacterium]